MDGDIGMRPAPGGGSCFWFTLPLEMAATDDVARAAPAARPARAIAGLRVLAVDDNATNRFVLRTILEAADCRVDLAENGQDAVRAAGAGDFDVILMDVHMPVLDGLDATREIRALAGPRSRVPIVAVTAEALPEQIERARAAGMDDHVTKPIRPDRLLEVLADIVRPAPGRSRSIRRRA
jgi:CheY-like chemotaxis protein